MISLQIFDWGFLCNHARIVLLCHASYELERSQKIVHSAPETAPIYKCIISASSTTLKADQNYRSSLESLSSAIAKHRNANAPHIIISERADLIGFIKQLKNSLDDVPDDASTCFVVDISVFPKDRLFVSIDLIKRVLPHARIVLGHSDPEKFDTDKEEKGWLSKGVIEVISLPGFNGKQDPEKKSLLILNMGHENERMSITINNREPQRLVLMTQENENLSSPASTLDRELFQRVSSDYGSIININDIKRVQSKDIVSVRDTILGIYDQYHEEYNIAISFLGTKIQAIGALLACQKNRNIEAIYAQPQIYHRENYSKGVSDSFMIVLS